MLDLPSSQDSLVRHIGSVVVVCEILVPQPGIKPVPSTVEAQNLNHWTTKGSPLEVIFDTFCLYCLQSKPSLVYSALTLFSCHHKVVFVWPDPPETTASTAWSQVCESHPFPSYLPLCHKAIGILVPQPGIEPGPWQLKLWSPNHWSTREFPVMSLCIL